MKDNKEYVQLNRILLTTFVQPFLFVATCVFSFSKLYDNFAPITVAFVICTMLTVCAYVSKIKFLCIYQDYISTKYLLIEQILFVLSLIANSVWLVFWQIVKLDFDLNILLVSLRIWFITLAVVAVVMMFYSFQRMSFMHTLLQLQENKCSANDCNTECKRINKIISFVDRNNILVGSVGVCATLLSLISAVFIFVCGTNNTIFYVYTIPLAAVSIAINCIAVVFANKYSNTMPINRWYCLLAMLCNVLIVVVSLLENNSELVIKDEFFAFSFEVTISGLIAVVALITLSLAIYLRINPNIHKRIRSLYLCEK